LNQTLLSALTPNKKCIDPIVVDKTPPQAIRCPRSNLSEHTEKENTFQAMSTGAVPA